MNLVDLDAKEPYVLDGRYVVNVMSLKPHVHFDYEAIRKEIEEKMTHGHWKIYSCRSYHYIRYICSECGTVYTTVKGYQYCPNCGARIDKKENIYITDIE